MKFVLCQQNVHTKKLAGYGYSVLETPLLLLMHAHLRGVRLRFTRVTLHRIHYY